MELERGDVAAGFPALMRAKQRFLERRATAAASRRAPSKPSPQAQTQDAPAVTGKKRTAALRPSAGSSLPAKTSSSLELVLLGFCHDLNDDLRALAHDVRVIDASVRQTHQRLCVDLDALTTAFIDSELQFSSSTELISSQETHKRRFKTSNNAVFKKTKKPLVIARQARQIPKATTTCKPHNRVTKLTLQAVHAHVIQHHYRRFLYRRLYTGGPQQLTTAVQLSKRTSLIRIWRRWTQFTVQRRRLKRRFAKLADVLNTRSSGDFCALEAVKVLESDGKYAMAKRFRELTMLCKVFSGWLGAVGS